ncbi:hypothetical protein SUNI508_10262 [Seiridium unicorne]|uniref:Capsule polysaccharide biosynthesis protein n=1 Tax=Seiridium unicorne TaxID=138068 RepID=A0ABR2UM87_9PEZI
MGDISAGFTIPKKYQDELEYAEISDLRSDAEILESLSCYSPVTSEKTIWGFWHEGLKHMPSWCQRNVIDWVRINPGWSVRILDNIPDSPHYALKYVSKDLLPAAFVDGKMDGSCIGPHSADLLRGACLYTYGGAWLDVGAILTRSIDRIAWKQLEDPESPFQVAAPHSVFALMSPDKSPSVLSTKKSLIPSVAVFKQCVANHFFLARKGDPFIKHWHDFFAYLWFDKTNIDGIIKHPLLAASVPTILAQYEAVAAHLWDWKISSEKALEYVTQIATWSHLCSYEDTGDGSSPADYWQKHIYLFDSGEDWPAEKILGFAGSGEKIMNLLALRRDGDKANDQYKQAEDLVWKLLAKSCMQKVTHAALLTFSPHLGTLWDMPENEGKDRAPGTFGELLRYGSVHFIQKRETVPRVPAPKPEVTWKKGLFDP